MAKKPKVLPPLEWLEPRVRLARALSLAAFCSLIVLIVVNTLFFTDLHGARSWVILGVQLVPLALVAPGVLSGNARAHAWMCFVLNLYFITGVEAAFDPRRAVFGWLEVVISLTLFLSALLYIRWRFQFDRRVAGEGAV